MHARASSNSSFAFKGRDALLLRLCFVILLIFAFISIFSCSALHCQPDFLLDRNRNIERHVNALDFSDFASLVYDSILYQSVAIKILPFGQAIETSRFITYPSSRRLDTVTS